jgi:hypothetical protein
MGTIMRLLVLLTLLAPGCACGDSHVVADAGIDASRLPTDAARDSALDTRFPLDFTGDAGCRRILGFRVCGEECIAPCTADDGRCSSLGVCYGAGRGIGFDCQANLNGGNYCGDGRICAVEEGVFQDPDSLIEGVCIDPEFCAELPTAGLASTQCQYSDGTMFVTGPPLREACPPSHPAFQFCGGPCAGVICPEESGVHLNRNCAGVSDHRAFGVCLRTNGFNCVNLPELNDFNHTLVDFCSGVSGELGFPEEACVILVPRPQAEGLPAEMGWPVPISVCRTYRELNPGFADCVDANWTPIP